MRDRKDWIIGGIIVIAFALIAIYFYISQQPSAQSIISLPVTYVGPVNVSNVAVEINYADVKQQCFGQSVQVMQGFTANGTANETVLITLSDTCQNVQKIDNVSTDTSGFSVIGTNPILPIDMRSGNKLTFNVTLRTPAGYSGVLNILVNAS